MVDTKTSKPLPFGTLGIHKVRANNTWRQLACTVATSYLLCFTEICLQGCLLLPVHLRHPLLQWRDPHEQVGKGSSRSMVHHKTTPTSAVERVKCYVCVCRAICERRKVLEQNIKEVMNHVVLSEQTLIKVRYCISKPKIHFQSLSVNILGLKSSLYCFCNLVDSVSTVLVFFFSMQMMVRCLS